MKSKKGNRLPARREEQGPAPASDRLIEALQDAVNRARDRKLAAGQAPPSLDPLPYTEGGADREESNDIE